MKKSFAIFCLTLTSWAFAGGFSTKSVLQSGNGTNGMTYSLLTDGGDMLPVITGTFGSVLQNCGQVTLRASSTNTLSSVGGITYIRASAWQPCADNAALFCYARYPAADVQFDGGTVSSSTNPSANSVTFNVGALPVLQSGSGWAWSCENCQQSSTLDAGVTVAYSLTTGSGSCTTP